MAGGQWTAFEALTTLRWIMLDRTLGVPRGAQLRARALAFARDLLPPHLRRLLRPGH